MPSSVFAFVDAALDRADHQRDDAMWLRQAWPDARVLLIDAEGRTPGDAASGPRVLHGRDLLLDATRMHVDAVFLGMHDAQAWFALPADAATSTSMSSDAPWIDLRSAAMQWPALEATAFAQARAVMHWRATHRHCAACGHALTYSRGGWQGDCAGCSRTHYPRTDPAVIVAVSDGERLLLGRQASWPEHRYSTLAGFVEPGESLEQTVAREVLEESGVRVTRCRYLASQPWPFPSSLMLGFIARAHPDTPQASSELEDARWFTREQVGRALQGLEPQLQVSPRMSISRWLIEAWHAGIDVE